MQHAVMKLIAIKKVGNKIDDWERFFAVIIIYDISGKIEAKQIETEYIRMYELKNGRKPRGNIRY